MFYQYVRNRSNALDRDFVLKRDFVVIQSHNSAEGFVDAVLSYYSTMAGGKDRVLCRGQASRDFDLVPSMFRSGALAHAHSILKDSPYGSLRIQTGENDKFPCKMSSYDIAEFNLVSWFYNLANRNGLTLPSVSFDAHQLLRHGGLNGITLLKAMQKENIWPPLEMWPVYALAQHHGVPTRFLDWSYDPFVAMYFAAKTAGRSGHEQFCVWLFLAESLIYFDQQRIRLFDPGYLSERGHVGKILCHVDTPRTANPNLHAQSGCFTLIAREAGASQSTDQNTLDVYDEMLECLLENSVGDLNPKGRLKQAPGVSYRPFVCFSTPRRNYKDVIKRLRSLNYSHSRIFPGLDGCRDEMFETEDIS